MLIWSLECRACRAITAPWVREQPGSELCDAYEAFQTSVGDREIPSGVYTLADIRRYGLDNGWYADMLPAYKGVGLSLVHPLFHAKFDCH